MDQNYTFADGIPLDPGASSLPLPEIIYQRLRLDILNGLLKPGQLLRQELLAQRSQTSRVPLREAMSRLEADGLVVLRPRRGYAVTSLDEADIVEIFELRMVVESHAGLIAAHARTTEDVRKVGQLVIAMEELNLKDSRYLSDWLRLNRAFHEALIGSARRRRLARIAGTLRDSVEPYIRVEAQMTGHVRDADAEHRAIFEAFRAGDARGLAELSRNHVENTERRLLEGLRKRGFQSEAACAPGKAKRKGQSGARG
jgi:DNA-binding GntR family transcriptional regulator